MVGVGPVVSVIIPSRGRAQQLRACVMQLRRSAPAVEIILVLDADDPESLSEMRSAIVSTRIFILPEVLSAPAKWNYGASLASGEALVLGEDDLWFHDGWYEQSLNALASIGGTGYVGFNSGHPHGCPNDYLASRDWLIDFAGGVLSIPAYVSQPGDMEMWFRAQRSERYIWADGKHSPFNAYVENRHPYLGKASWDATYERGHMLGKTVEEGQLYLKRLEAGFPDNFHPVLRRLA